MIPGWITCSQAAFILKVKPSHIEALIALSLITHKVGPHGNNWVNQNEIEKLARIVAVLRAGNK